MVPTQIDDLPKDQELQTQAVEFPVVGLGASAGGLKALQQFFAQMPADSGMTFVVLLSLSAQQESQAVTVLRNSLRMQVMQVTEPVVVEPNKIYFLPSTKRLSISDGLITLTETGNLTGPHVAVDLLFRALADAYNSRVACVVLSGTAASGAIGLKRVRERGGVVIAQEPRDAEYDPMPRNAIGTGLVDLVLPAAAMPGKLIEIWRNAGRIKLPEEGATPELGESRTAEDALRDILANVLAHTKRDFSHYEPAAVLRRVKRRMLVSALPALPSYGDYLRQNAPEAKRLLKDLLVPVTDFFSDRAALGALEQEVVPRLFEGKGAGDTVRVWVVECATGEEAYSVAMLLLNHAASLPQPPEVQVFATDIDEEAISTAREGVYPAPVEMDVAPARLRSFFTKETDYYRVNKELRDQVLFTIQDLISDPPFSRLDCVICRHLLANFRRDVRERVFELFHFALRPGGFLFLDDSEPADARPDLFAATDKKHRIFRTDKTAHAPRHAPAMPLVGIAGGSAQTALAGRKPKVRSERSRAEFAELQRNLLERHAPPSAIINSDTAPEEIAHAFEAELQQLRSQLGATTEQYETTVEELKTSNEELQSTNEELRMAAEENETGREELQSVNEEFNSVNQELKIKIEEVSSANDDLRNLMSSTDIATIFLDRALRIKRYTPRARTLFNFIESDEGRELADVTHKLDYDGLLADAGRVLDTLNVTEKEVASTEERTFLARLLPYRGSNGRIDGVVLNFVDITERKQAEEELRRSHEELENRVLERTQELIESNEALTRQAAELREQADLLNLAYDAIIVRDAEDRIIFWNRGAERLYGWTAEEAIGHIAIELWQTVFPQPVEEIHRALWRDKRWEGELSHVRRDGSRVVVASRWALQDDGGQTVKIMQINLDITKRKEAEGERERLLRKLVQTQEEERRRLSRELHDHFGQQLTALMLGIEILPRREQLSEGIEDLKAIIKRLGADVDFLAWELRPAVLDDFGLVSAVANFVEEWSHRMGITAEFHSAGLDGDRLLFEVETTLYRIAQEALNNVSKHSQASRVDVILERREGCAVLVIEDNGVGFDPEQEGILTAPGKELGIIGMRERAALVGGAFEIESSPGDGTTVFVRIPLNQANQ